MPDLSELRERVKVAMKDFRQTVHGLSQWEFEPVSIDQIVHDNVKVVEANSENFSFTLQSEKQQVVVVLRGNWKLVHGNKERKLAVTDVVRVPMGSPFDTIMYAEEPDAKFVYIQFK